MPTSERGPLKNTLIEFGEFILELAKVIIISLAIILPIRYFVVQPFYVNGQSMEPTFDNNEYLLIDEISYRFHTPERGDVVVFRPPNDPSKFYIKRLIGLPGETVIIGDGHVMIKNSEHPDGFVLDEPYLDNQQTVGNYNITIPAGEFFFLGDNRGQSLDSRVFGPVKAAAIVGRVWIRALPVSRWTVFTSSPTESSNS